MFSTTVPYRALIVAIKARRYDLKQTLGRHENSIDSIEKMFGRAHQKLVNRK